MKKLLPCAILILCLSGCTVEIINLQSKGIVEPETTPKTMTVAQAMPWNAIVDFLSRVLPTAGQTRRLAIENRVKYTEERNWTLFRVEKAGTSESKVEKQGDDYKSKRREELQ